MILKFTLLIFPKYVAVLENVQIEDHYSKPGSTIARFIDIALVDANGNLDVIEIKRPFDDVLLSRTLYRDNFVPSKDLSGTIHAKAVQFLFQSFEVGCRRRDQTYQEVQRASAFRDVDPHHQSQGFADSGPRSKT